MAYDEGLAQRVRETIDHPARSERKMFGGLCFMVAGHMAVGVVGADLIVRVGRAAHADALEDPWARPMDFTGTPSKGMVYVAPEGLEDDEDLRAWVARGVAYAASLPPK